MIDFNFGTAALPLGRTVQRGGGLLQGVEHEARALVVDAIVGQGIEHLRKRDLHSMHVFDDGKLNAASFATAAGASVEMEVTVILAL